MGFIADKAKQFGNFVDESATNTVNDLTAPIEQFGDFVGEQVDNFTGATAAEASKEASETQAAAIAEGLVASQAAGVEAQGFLDPFSAIGQQGIDRAGFLTDPQAQFDFLQNNPLFKAALDNANRNTSQLAASRGRLAAGDTLTSLAGNTLTTAAPLIDRQKQSILDLLGIGSNTATAQANTALGVGSNVSNALTSIGDVNAAGIVGEANALTSGTENLLGLGLAGAGLGLEFANIGATNKLTEALKAGTA